MIFKKFMCESPTFSEYLLAAKLPKFLVSHTFESIVSPPYDVCTWNKGVLEAEGVDGHIYFSGIGSHVPKELEYISGGINPRDSISRIHYNIYAFWGDEYKPSPRTSRCVQRNSRNLMKGTIKRNTVEVKSRRDQSSKTKMTLARGAEISIIYTNNKWSFINAKGSHECQPDPEWTKFEDYGWIATADYESNSVYPVPQPGVSSAKPPIPYEDFGGCPFEGCVYREWIATRDAKVFKDRNEGSPIVFTVKKGEKVTAIGGVVITVKPGRAKVLAEFDYGDIRIKAGDIICLLSYRGEGRYKVWFQGTLMDEFQHGEIPRKIIEEGQYVWWVNIKNRKGQTGWSNKPDFFDNKDLFG